MDSQQPALVTAVDNKSLKKTNSRSSSESLRNEKVEKEVDAASIHSAKALDEEEKKPSIYRKYRPFILGFIALVILGWWISSIVLKGTRRRWYTPFS